MWAYKKNCDLASGGRSWVLFRGGDSASSVDKFEDAQHDAGRAGQYQENQSTRRFVCEEYRYRHEKNLLFIQIPRMRAVNVTNPTIVSFGSMAAKNCSIIGVHRFLSFEVCEAGRTKNRKCNSSILLL